MQYKLAHVYDAVGFYTTDWNCEEDQITPGEFIKPGLSTFLPLPNYSTNQWPQLVNEAWVVVPSYVGETWYDQITNLPVVIETHGQPASNLAATQSSDYLAAQVRVLFKLTAQDALSKSDITISRCVENSVVVPTAWATYRKALRAIVDGSDSVSTVLPTVPGYPSGT